MKIATCSYCGTRAALVLGAGRLELTCSACGAPLHALKMLPVGPQPAPATAVDHRKPPKVRPEKAKKPKAPKRRKGLFARVLDEAMDMVEDIFD